MCVTNKKSNHVIVHKINFNMLSFEQTNFHKTILVPFGEFLPFRNFLYFLEAIVGGNDFTSGNNIRLLKTSDNLNILPIICWLSRIKVCYVGHLQKTFYCEIYDNIRLFLKNVIRDKLLSSYLHL